MSVKSFSLCAVVLFSLISIPVKGQEIGEQKLAFQGGEELKYLATYKAGLINAELAEISFNTMDSNINGEPVYHVKAIAEIYPSYKIIFEMRDEYNTWLRKSDLKPVYFENFIKEGSYVGQGNMTYDWDKKEVVTWWKNFKRGHENYHTFELSENSFDGLALFFNLRNTDLQDVQEGHSAYIDLVLSDTIKRLQYKFLGREVRNIPRVGKFATLKFSCQLTTSEAESFKEGSEFYIWLSDDDNKIPLYLETPIRIGSVRARIMSWKNLKHPLNKK